MALNIYIAGGNLYSILDVSTDMGRLCAEPNSMNLDECTCYMNECVKIIKRAHIQYSSSA